MLGEVWESVLGCGGGNLGDVGRSVGVWRSVGGGVGKCVWVWNVGDEGRCGKRCRKCWGRCGKVCWGVG